MKTTFTFETGTSEYIGYTAVPTSTLAVLFSRLYAQYPRDDETIRLVKRCEEFQVQGKHVVRLPSGQESFDFDIKEI